MPEPMSCAGCYTRTEIYCDRCDLLVGLPGMHVINVAEEVGGGLTVTVESPPAAAGCRVCGVIAASHGRRTAVLVDVPCFGRETGSGRHLGSVPRLQERHRRPTRRRHLLLDAFHVVKLGGQAVDEVRRRVEQAICGHRGRKSDPLYGIRNLLRCGKQRLTDRQQARLVAANHTWRCSSPGSAQQLRQV